jgi:hypothetical protein
MGISFILSRMWPRIGFPATCISDFGVLKVCGWSLVPMPATGITTFISILDLLPDLYYYA